MSVTRFLLLILLSSITSTLNSVSPDDLDHLALEGAVTDPPGAAIPGARITARQIGTGHRRSTVTDSEGRYRLTRLGPGVYHLTAEASGFRAAVYEGLSGAAGTTIRRDFQLAPSPIEAGITIEASTSGNDVDTSRTVIGSTLGKNAIDELPSAERNVLDLLLTLPGVTEPALSTSALAEGDDADRFRSTPEEAGIFALNGGTPFSNNLTIEGLDNNDDRAARERFIPTIDAVEEVQVIANQFSAEYGRASGGRVNVRLRSGAENYRGRLFQHFRDSRLNANSYHRNADPSRGFRIPFTEHNAGATLGGPLVPERISFFAAYEYARVADHAEIAALVPAARNPAFNMPLPNGTILGSNGVDRQGGQIVVNGGASVGLYDLTVATPKRADTVQSRIDFKAGDRQSAFAVLTMSRILDERGFPGGRRTLETMRASGRNSASISGSEALVLSERAISETRFQYSRLSPLDAPPSANTVVLIEMEDPRDIPGNSNPLSRRGSLLAGSSNIGGTTRREDRLQVQQVLTLMTGAHQARAGLDVQFIRSRFVDLEDITGTFTFATPADFLMNKVARYRQRFNTSSLVRNTYTGFYFQDDWRIRPNLTVSGGLRWDYETSLEDRNNLGPRLAVAWDPESAGKMVIRGGFGLFYNRVLLRTLDDFTLTSGSLLIDTNLPSAEALLPSLRFPQALSSGDPRVQQMAVREQGFIRRLERGLRIPESYQTAIGFETRIERVGRFELNYVYNRGAHLWREINANAPQLPRGFADFSSYLVSRDFANARDPVTGTRPITATGNADVVRFDLSQVASRTIVEGDRRVVIFGLNNQSTSNATSGMRAALGALRPLRADPHLEQIEELQARGNSYYHSLTASLERTGTQGQVRVAYTLSRLVDDGVVNTSSALVAGDFRRELSLSLLDSRHRIVASGVHRLTVIPGGLSLSATFSVSSPRPFSIGINGNDRNLDDVSNDRPNYKGPSGPVGWRKPGSEGSNVVFDRFSLPAIGGTGNVDRNAGRGPWQHSLSVRLSVVLKLSERMRVTPLIETFNPLNATVFSFGSEFVDYTPTGAADFLIPRRTLRPRSVRLGLRFEF